MNMELAVARYLSFVAIIASVMTLTLAAEAGAHIGLRLLLAVCCVVSLTAFIACSER